MRQAAQTPAETAPKGKRVTIDLTPAATQEVERLLAVTGLTTADVFRNALTLLRIYVKARSEGKEVRLVDPSTPETQILLELPIHIAAGSQGR